MNAPIIRRYRQYSSAVYITPISRTRPQRETFLFAVLRSRHTASWSVHCGPLLPSGSYRHNCRLCCKPALQGTRHGLDIVWAPSADDFHMSKYLGHVSGQRGGHYQSYLRIHILLSCIHPGFLRNVPVLVVPNQIPQVIDSPHTQLITALEHIDVLVSIMQ